MPLKDGSTSLCGRGAVLDARKEAWAGSAARRDPMQNAIFAPLLL